METNPSLQGLRLLGMNLREQNLAELWEMSWMKAHSEVFLTRSPSLVASLGEQIASESDLARKAELQERLRVQTDYMNAIGEVVPTPPNITLADKMTLFQVVPEGSREIQLLHFGRAHTGGDVVIYLPQEKVVFTGDMMLPGLAYMGDGHVDEWPDALEGLKGLDFDTWLPGHGPVMRSKVPISNFQDYLRDLWVKSNELYRLGVEWQEAAMQIDMTNHARNYFQIRGPGVDPRAIRRIFELLDARLKINPPKKAFVLRRKV